jgi:C4-type Zn-finger protein
MAREGIGNKPTVSILKFHDCPACKETIFAAEGATFAPLAVIFKWCCDLCGHQFETVEPVEEAA